MKKKKVGSKTYLKYYNEGEKAYFDGKDDPCDNPYTDGDDLFKKGYPWYDGYRQAKSKFNENKYKIPEFKEKVLKLIKEYGFKIYYDDEYGRPYLETDDQYSFHFVD